MKNKREPKNAELKLEVAKFYIVKDDTEKVKKLVEKAIRLKPSNEKILRKSLEVYDKIQNYDAMYDICEELRETNLIKAQYMIDSYNFLYQYEMSLDKNLILQGKLYTPIYRNS